MADLTVITKEVEVSIQDPQVQATLLSTVFKGFALPMMKAAIVEGRIRGFDFKDFLEKNIYAIPYGQGYSLVTSVDYARKVAMRSGIAGITEPIYEEDGKGELVACSVTVKRVVSGHLGEFTAKVYFKEYYAGNKNEDGSTKTNKWGEMKPTLWDTKPRTMIAKVAEMHALRKACPEELSQAYVEEEMIKETISVEPAFDISPYKAKIEATTTGEELRRVWSALPIQAKEGLRGLANERREALAQTPNKPVTPKVPVWHKKTMTAEEPPKMESKTETPDKSNKVPILSKEENNNIK